jgi:hypothetical protein
MPPHFAKCVPMLVTEVEVANGEQQPMQIRSMLSKPPFTLTCPERETTIEPVRERAVASRKAKEAFLAKEKSWDEMAPGTA